MTVGTLDIHSTDLLHFACSEAEASNLLPPTGMEFEGQGQNDHEQYINALQCCCSSVPPANQYCPVSSVPLHPNWQSRPQLDPQIFLQTNHVLNLDTRFI